MEITGSAGRHGVSEEDIRHDVRNPIRQWPMDGYVMIVGPARDGSLLEIAMNEDEQAFHAVPARAKFL